MTIIETTQSICPECKKNIPAQIVEFEKKIYMKKHCPDHGDFSDLYWGDASTYRDQMALVDSDSQQSTKKTPCPSECGLCENHKSSTVLANIDITTRCNFSCPTCFADAFNANASQFDLSIEEISHRMDVLKAVKPPCHSIQFSGGEPTLHPEFFQIVRLAREKGFVQLQVATNGKRLADDKAFARQLAASDFDTVYLQFDGVTPKPYEHLRGFNALPIKLRAIENIRDAGPRPNIVLVPTIVNGVNDHQIGEIIQFALKNSDVVRGVNFQPVSIVGRIDQNQLRQQRITIPDIILRISSQFMKEIQFQDFFSVYSAREALTVFDKIEPRGFPVLNTHPLCGYWTFLLKTNWRVIPISQVIHVHRLFNYFKRIKSRSKFEMICGVVLNLHTFFYWNRPVETWQLFLKLLRLWMTRSMVSASSLFNNKDILFIGMMHFMDPYNLDMRRLERCCVHYAIENDRIVPFCSYNLFYRQSS
ncbi:tetraether lipid synthase Tes [bacterium]